MIGYDLPESQPTEFSELEAITRCHNNGEPKKTASRRKARKALTEREAARRLAALGGTVPQLKNIPRRRTPRTPL